MVRGRTAYGSLGFGGEESAGASFLRRDGAVGAPIKTASSWACLRRRFWRAPAKTPANIYRELTERFGAPVYERIDAPATPEQKATLAKLSPIK